jgi:hypothetical protein
LLGDEQAITEDGAASATSLLDTRRQMLNVFVVVVAVAVLEVAPLGVSQ